MSVGFSEDFTQKHDDAPWSGSSENSNGTSRSSSTQSWIDDSEVTITNELKDQYEKFEEALYSERSLSDLPKALQAEVKIWSEHSPHIRVKGTKAKIYERPENYVDEEEYDSNYEEVIETHGSLEESLEKSLSFNEDVKHVIDNYPFDEQEVIKTDLKNAIVDKLFDHALPKVLQKIEPVIKSVSAGKRKAIMSAINQSDEYLNNVRNQHNQRLLGRSKSSRHTIKDITMRKPLPSNESTGYQSCLSSHGLRRREFEQFPEEPESGHFRDEDSHLGVTNAKVNRTSSFSNQRLSRRQPENLRKNRGPVHTYNEEKSMSLPVIEALPITPKTPDKRSVSAMVRFTKTLPRVGPNTARHNRPYEAPFLQVKNIPSIKPLKECGDTNITHEKSARKKNTPSTDIDLKVIGTRSATSVKNNKWRY